MFRLAYRLFAGGSILLACASACADGKFHFYNSLDDKLPFRVSLSAGQSKPTMKSENLLEYHGEPWTCALAAGQYYLVLEGRGWSRDVGWIDIEATIPEGNVLIGWDNAAWQLVETRKPDGSLAKAWEAAMGSSSGGQWSMTAGARPPSAGDDVEEAPPPQPKRPAPRINASVVVRWIENDKNPAGRAAPAAAAKAPSPPLRRQHHLSITVHKDEQGVYIDSVAPGGAATRCRDANGKTVQLEPGDHILTWNGKTPASLQEYLDAVAGSEEADLEVEDGNTGETMQLHVRLD